MNDVYGNVNKLLLKQYYVIVYSFDNVKSETLWATVHMLIHDKFLNMTFVY